MSNTYSTHTIGSKYTFDYKVYILENKKIVSPFHSINLYQHEDTSIVTVVNEIPRFENAKFEISKDISLNPIKQDIKNEKLRFTKNMFPFKGYMWNYGAIPQTWEDKDQVCGYTGCRGDNDPLDVIDFSKIKKKVGEVYQAKVLGCLALIDEGECDWKIIVIDINDDNAFKIKSVEDIELFYPDYLEFTKKWFQSYKIPEGKGRNHLGMNERILDGNFACNIINEAHESWKKLFERKHIKSIKYETEGECVEKDHDNETISFDEIFYFCK